MPGNPVRRGRGRVAGPPPADSTPVSKADQPPSHRWRAAAEAAKLAARAISPVAAIVPLSAQASPTAGWAPSRAPVELRSKPRSFGNPAEVRDSKTGREDHVKQGLRKSRPSAKAAPPAARLEHFQRKTCGLTA